MTRKPVIRLSISFFIITISLCFFSGAPAYSLETIVVDDNLGKLSLGTKMEYLEDKNNSLTFRQIISGNLSKSFIKSKMKTPHFGYTPSVYWVRFAVKNKSDKNMKWFLEVNNPIIDSITLYSQGKNDEHLEKMSGDTLPFSQREIKHRKVIFPLTIPTDRIKTYYIRFKTKDSSMILTLALWSPEAFFDSAKHEYMALGLFYGVILVMIFYNLFLYMAVRDLTYLYYVSFMFYALIFNLTMDGILFEWLPFGAGSWFNSHIMLISFVMFIAGFQFIRSFLNITAEDRILYRAIQIFMGLSLLGLGISLFYVSSETYQIGNYFAMTEAIIAMVAGTIRLRRGFKPARIFLAAWSTFSLGVVVMTLRLLGFLPDTLFTHHTMKIGSIVEVILLSFALGDRITIMRQDKEKAQHMALRNLQENYRLKEEFARTLEEKIETRTHELNEKNLELKRLSVTDKLTQLYNRNRIDEILDYEIKQSSRYHRDLSIIMMDLDHFKSVNDQLGHQVGDEVLKEFAGLIKELLRTTDTVGRWGGEEFIVISPNSSGDEIMYLAEKLRKSVESHEFKGVGVMTCSCGVSSYEPGDDEISMLKRADEALYQAKSEGRNRVR